MPRPKNIIPSQQLNVALPLPLYTQLGAYLYSELEERVPHGAYSRFLTNLLRGFFSQTQLDLAPWIDSDPGAYIVSGSPEAIKALELSLSILAKGTPLERRKG